MTKSTRVLIRAKGRGLCIERGLHDCFQRELFADITFNCDEGEKIRANKGVLAAASPVLCTLLKDWPFMEDSCIIMAGYSKEEVQGLVKYIYTGQLSAPKVQGSSWEKIIEDFRVGTPLEHEDDLASIHELEDFGEDTPTKNETESNVAIERQSAFAINPTSKYVPSRTLGPKIVAVTSPRPLIVQVQSLTQVQSSTIQNFEGAHDGMDIPNEMIVMENDGLSDVVPSSSTKKHQGGKRKRALATVAPVQFQVKKPLLETAPSTGNSRLTLPPLRLSLKKPSLSGVKRSKPAMSKFSRKKYVCPHCNRRFLTRGNIKNHLRTHNKDKPFQCTICQDLFAYHGVFQRHLIKHLEKKEISEAELEPLIAESRRLAGEIAKEEQDSVQVVEEDDDAEEPPGDGSGDIELNEVKEEAVDEAIDEVEEDEEEEENAEVDENGDLDEEEAHIALKLQSRFIAGSSKSGMGTHFLCMDTKAESSGQDEEDPGEIGKPTRKKAAISARGIVSPAVVFPSDAELTSRKSEPESLIPMKVQTIKCDFCPMKFQKWSAFYIHRCSHTGEVPIFPCGICEQEFSDIKALKEHKISEHRDSMFQCESCDRIFLSKSALQMHQPVHSTDFNFQCRHCPQKMKTLKERYVHERTHMPDVSLKCSHCDKQFNTMVSFRSHSKTHGKEEDEVQSNVPAP